MENNHFFLYFAEEDHTSLENTTATKCISFWGELFYYGPFHLENEDIPVLLNILCNTSADGTKNAVGVSGGQIFQPNRPNVI